MVRLAMRIRDHLPAGYCDGPGLSGSWVLERGGISVTCWAINQYMPSQSLFVDIPVLPHVKNLMLSLYGPEPIRASINNLPGKELQFIFLSNKSQPEKINGETISLQVSHRLAPYFYKFNNALSLGC